MWTNRHLLPHTNNCSENLMLVLFICICETYRKLSRSGGVLCFVCRRTTTPLPQTIPQNLAKAQLSRSSLEGFGGMLRRNKREFQSWRTRTHQKAGSSLSTTAAPNRWLNRSQPPQQGTASTLHWPAPCQPGHVFTTGWMHEGTPAKAAAHGTHWAQWFM